MVFSGLPFLFLFLTAVLVIHYFVPGRERNYLLLLANLVFYAYGEPVYVLLMLASMTVNFAAAYMIERTERIRIRRLVLVFCVIVNLGALGWFKYANLLVDTLRMLPALFGLPALSVTLPIGISFYTFQAMSYVIDVYRRDCRASVSLVDFAAYISLFPQLIAGPIVRYSDVALQLQQRETSAGKFSWGVRLFAVGLAKKVLLANQFALLWEQVAADPAAAGTLAVWCGVAAYAMQIYLDFGGYSDMARGLGAMLGFDFCINFDYPYLSRSITEFWRRWHISLSTWFRDYVYIPLGGSRCSKPRMACNLMIVWMLTGFWHGAGWNFLFWGFYYGVLLLLEKFLLAKYLEKLPSVIRWLYAMGLVCIGWVFFASSGLDTAWNCLKVMFSLTPGQNPGQLLSWLPLGLAGMLTCTPLAVRLWGKWDGTAAAAVAEALLCLIALVLCTAALVSGSYNPFLYFRF